MEGGSILNVKPGSVLIINQHKAITNDLNVTDSEKFQKSVSSIKYVYETEQAMLINNYLAELQGAKPQIFTMLFGEVYTPSNITVSTIKCTYSGSIIRPAIIVRDNDGKEISDIYYRISYSNNTDVGQATATIIFFGLYDGIAQKKFSIYPQKTKLTNLAPKKKGFKIKWKKISKQVDGYELQYSSKKSMIKTKTKTVKITSNKKTSVAIGNLNALKKFYIRIRTYKNVHGKIYYSDWSGIKSVTTKK